MHNFTIFKLLVERVMRIQMIAHKSDRKLMAEHQKCKILIMTSPQNHLHTLMYFRACKFFGFKESSFVFF